MKKVLFGILLAVLAASAVSAMSITDWSGGDVAYSRNPDALTDYGTNGFKIDLTNFVPEGDRPDRARFIASSSHVSDWTFDENEDIHINITGFGEYFYPNDLSQGYSVTLVLAGQSTDEKSPITYAEIPYTGAGEYVITTEDFTFTEALQEQGFVYLHGYAVRSILFAVGGGQLGPGAYGTVEFSLGDPKTVVPEPATAAYGVMGLVSLIGIKRKFNK